MAVLLRTNIKSADHHEDLLNRLLAEWRSPQVSEDAEPVIIEERPGNYDRVNHLYVVWSDWEDLSPLERSKLILQAYEQYRGNDLAASITLAMGLTPAEARQMGIELG